MVQKREAIIGEPSSFWCENRLKVFVWHFKNHHGWNLYWPFWKHGFWTVASFEISFFIWLCWFRKNGPSEEEVESSSFKMWFVGRGFSKERLASQENTKPDMEIVTRVTGPEIGYAATPIILVQCALILLSQHKNLLKGGVYPPGIVFGPSDLQQKLQQNGISFDVISKSTIPS